VLVRPGLLLNWRKSSVVRRHWNNHVSSPSVGVP
jgi:hypothetical protein